MKKMTKMLASILGLAMTAAVTTATAAETDKPVLSGDTITCGAKTVKWNQEGEISISNAAGRLMWLNPHFCYMTADQKKVDWFSFTKAECQVKVEDGKVVWNLKKKLGDQVYDAGTQTLEITPEGLLKYTCKINQIAAQGWIPRNPNAGLFIFTPYALTEGKDLILNGKRYKMVISDKAVCVEWRAKAFNYVFYPDDADSVIAVKGAKPEIGHDTACIKFQYTKAFRTSYATNNDMSATLTLDLRKEAGK